MHRPTLKVRQVHAWTPKKPTVVPASSVRQGGRRGRSRAPELPQHTGWFGWVGGSGQQQQRCTAVEPYLTRAVLPPPAARRLSPTAPAPAASAASPPALAAAAARRRCRRRRARGVRLRCWPSCCCCCCCCCCCSAPMMMRSRAQVRASHPPSPPPAPPPARHPAAGARTRPRPPRRWCRRRAQPWAPGLPPPPPPPTGATSAAPMGAVETATTFPPCRVCAGGLRLPAGAAVDRAAAAVTWVGWA
jgi:hypothetical protein